MGTRVRKDPKFLFDVYCEVLSNENRKLVILNKYPETYNESEIRDVPQFSFPCDNMDNYLLRTEILHYSFVLTSADSKYTFGFCRYDPTSKIAMVILSALPWHDIFFKLLNCLSPLAHQSDRSDLISFLAACHVRPPLPGHVLKITYNNGQNIFKCENRTELLPSIPDNFNMTQFFSALDTKCMCGLFAALLHERRIAIVATKPSRISAVVQAANSILYPMSWQHIFIPILPKGLVDYLLAPMPFLIGVPRSVINNIRLNDIGDIVLLDADSKELKTPFNDLESLPSEVVNNLKKALGDKNALGDAVSRAFLRALVHLIGGYRHAINIDSSTKITFSPTDFKKTRKNMEECLSWILEAQIFQQFIEERLELLNGGHGFSDEFESECCEFEERLGSGSGFIGQRPYKEWMKREGGALLKTVKDKANPAMKSAVHTFRQGGRNVKSVVKNLKMKMPKSAGKTSTTDETKSTSSSCESVGSHSSGRSAPISLSKSHSDIHVAAKKPNGKEEIASLLDLSPNNTNPFTCDFPSIQRSSDSSPLFPSGDLESVFNQLQMNQNNSKSESKSQWYTQPSSEPTLIDFSKKSTDVPPRLPERPQVASRYAIVATRNLVDVSDAPRPPPRASNEPRARSQFYSEITKSEHSAASRAAPVHFRQVHADGRAAAERKMSLWKAAPGIPPRNNNLLKATLSAPPATRSQNSVNHKPISNTLPREGGSGSVESDLIKLGQNDGSASNVLQDFDPLHWSKADGFQDPKPKQKSTGNINSVETVLTRRPNFDWSSNVNWTNSQKENASNLNVIQNKTEPSQSDQELLQEYGIDFNRFGRLLDRSDNESEDSPRLSRFNKNF